MHQGCSSSRLLIPLFVRGRLHSGASHEKRKQLALSFHFTFRNIDDVPSLNNSTFGDFVDRIYLIELEMKDTSDIAKSASYLDLHLEIDSEVRFKNETLWQKGLFQFSHYELSIYMWQYFSDSRGVYISPLLRYTRACGSYHDFLDRGLLITRNLLIQGFQSCKCRHSPELVVLITISLIEGCW